MENSVALVEDEPWIINGLEKTFNWDKYGLSLAYKFTSSQEAAECLIKNKVDVIFTDIRMPGMNGLELIHRLRTPSSKNTDTLIVIISGYTDYEYMREAIMLGITDYCLKPIDRDNADFILNNIRTKINGKVQIDSLVNYPDLGDEFGALIDYVNKNTSQKLLLQNLAQMFHFNSNYLGELFKKHFNMTFSEYLLSKRMQKSYDLLKQSKYSVNEIVDMVGFSDYAYFHKRFTQYWGKTPGQIRKSSLFE